MAGSFRGGALVLTVLATGLYAPSAGAQLIVDDSGAKFPDEVRNEIFELVTENFRDPLSSQFRRLHRATKPNRYCGEVNTRNMYGAYGGFKPFLVILEPNQRSADVMPSDEPPKLKDAELKAKLQAMKDAGCQFGGK
jgi:hypothetical protein